MSKSIKSEKKYQNLIHALEVHGAILPCELQSLKMTLSDARKSNLVNLVENTIIGPLLLPTHHRFPDSVSGNINKPTRTANSAIDSAYLRLFIRRSSGEWFLPSPHKLGRLQSDLMDMPVLRRQDKVYIVSGKAQGGGITSRRLKRYLEANSLKIITKRMSLLIVSPSCRYDVLLGRYSKILEIAKYPINECKEDNIISI